MAFTQETFLGASIRYFNCTVGWGDQASILNVGLVDDPLNGDEFDPPDVGRSVYFDYQGWKFGGILYNVKTEYGEGGNPVYSVEVRDPRELLEGVQLVLNDYAGPTAIVPNLYNIYGYWEYVRGYGGSLVNDSGMLWLDIRDGFINLQNTGYPIQFRNEDYYFRPFQGLESYLPYWYRVGGQYVSVLEYVEDICGAIGCDYHFSLQPGNIITLNLVNRRSVLRTGSIEEFVAETDGAVSKNNGFELQNATTSKFIVGGRTETMYFQTNETGGNDDPEDPSTYFDNTIMPFWGYDAYNNLIVGTGPFVSASGDGSDYTVTLDGRPIYIQTGIPATIFYQTDLAELRYARAGQDAWESFLWWYNDEEGSIHKGKAEQLGLMEGMNTSFKELINTLKTKDNIEIDDLKRMVSMAPAEKTRINLSQFDNETHKRKIEKIYEHVRTYATEFYGRKFMVRIPFIYAALIPETNNIRFSVTPLQEGYIEESLWYQWQYQGYMPFNPEKFTNDDNKIHCYVRFANMQSTEGEEGITCKYALDALSPNDYILDQYPDLSAGTMRENLFVKAEVEPQIVFLYPNSLYSPRVVITLPAPVGDNASSKLTMSRGILGEIVNAIDSNPTMPESDKRKLNSHISSSFGADLGYFGKDALLYAPDLAVLPLQSNVERYGPWYWSVDLLYGTNTNRIYAGKCDYSIDDTLVPWEYGGWDPMYWSGMARVQESIISQQIMENGTITFPGVPDKQLGNELLTSGPVITDISVSAAEEGVTTTYRMNTWIFQFGKIGKYNVDRFKRISKNAQEQRKFFRKLFGYRENLRLSTTSSRDLNTKNKRSEDTKSSSSLILAGDVIHVGEGDALRVRTNVATIAGHKTLTQINEEEYVNKAAMSFDGIFCPYTTDPATATLFPKFETPATDAETPTCIELNPFGDKSIAFALPEGDMPENLCTEYDGYDGHVKAVGIKAPIIIAGWGYDIDGNPVPNEGTEFIEDHKNRADQWKVGPLDVRWDYNRKVWVASGGQNRGYVPGKVTTEITGRQDFGTYSNAGSGIADLYILGSGNIRLEVIESGVTIYNDYSSSIVVDSWITVELDRRNVYWIVGADCP